MTLPEETTIETLLEAIRSTPSRLLEEVTLLDIYRSDKIGSENKNITFRFTYRNSKKTVSQEAVDAEHARIEKEVYKRITNLGDA